MHPHDLDRRPASTLEEFQLVTLDEVERIVKNSPSRSCDLDSWPTWLVKKHLHALLPTLMHLINASIRDREVPLAMKQAIITPILKKPSLKTNELSSYRPVSNLSFISKILERVICDQLTKYLNENELHHYYQSAYRAHHSVETALVKVQNDIVKAIDQKKHVVLVLLDLSAAFDTVDHGILLQRLRQRFGIESNALDWLSSYLNARGCRVKVGDELSPPSQMQDGVPQGSVLGPVLFSLYISPLYDIVRQHGVSTHQYADDCQLYLELDSADAASCGDGRRQLEDCVRSIAKWMSVNKLKLNDNKSEVIAFCPPRVQTPLPFDHLQLCDTASKFSTKVRDLGVIFEKSLNPETFVNSVCSACYYHLSNIGAIRNSLSKASAEKLIHAFISSKIDFCNALYVFLPARIMAKLQRVQNAAARLVSRTPKRHHITPILRQLHWLPIQYRVQYKIAMLAWKTLNARAPKYMKDMIEEYEPPRELRSTGTRLLVVSQPRTELGKRAFSFAAPYVFNGLPENLRVETSHDAFKRNLKTCIFIRAFD